MVKEKWTGQKKTDQLKGMRRERFEKKIRKDIIYKDEIVCFVPNNRIYFVRDNKLFWAVRKRGMRKSFGTLKNLRKKISIKEETIHELGLVEESFQKEKLKDMSKEFPKSIVRFKTSRGYCSFDKNEIKRLKAEEKI